METIEVQCLRRCEDWPIPVLPFPDELRPVFLWNDDNAAVAVSDTRIAGQFVVVARRGYCTFKMTENRLELHQRHRWKIGKLSCNGLWVEPRSRILHDQCIAIQQHDDVVPCQYW